MSYYDYCWLVLYKKTTNTIRKLKHYNVYYMKNHLCVSPKIIKGDIC